MARAPQRFFIIIDDEVVFGCAGQMRFYHELDKYISNNYKIFRSWNNRYSMRFYELEEVE